MRRFWLSVLGLLLSLNAALTAQATEPYLQFVQGLREKKYYDYALLYLKSLKDRVDVPDEVRQVIPFEQAALLQDDARSIRNPDTKGRQLDRALALLKQFVDANPRHPKVGPANSQRARILIGKAEFEIWRSQSPANTSNKGQLQADARTLIKQARDVFQQAHDQHQECWKAYPPFIDEDEQPQLFEERRGVEVAYIRVQVDLALCTYHEAQSYDRQAPEYRKLLTSAALEFEEIHSRYRSINAGLYARMRQGKCFEEQDEIGKALGIYKELLGHGNSTPGERPKPVEEFLRTLQGQVLQFQLICLNHEKRKDFQLVVQKASDWLKAAGRRGGQTTRGLAIHWERARAYEALGAERTLPESERKQFLSAALTDAREINRWPGQYRDVSTFMIQRLLVALDKNPQDPKNFDAALGMADYLIKQIKGFDDEIEDPNNQDKVEQLKRDRDEHLQETSRILKLALNLVTDETEPKQFQRTRYLLGYVYYLTGDSYEAAILGEFVGRHVDKDNSQMGLDAAYLALAAFLQAYTDVPRGEPRYFEMQQMTRVCSMITTSWPQSDHANDARMTLGRIYGQREQPVQAAEWYDGVPQTSPRYTEAQLAAGQSYWSAYLTAAPLHDDDPNKPDVEKLQHWQDAAAKHLAVGIVKSKEQLPENVTSGAGFAEYIAAKVSMSQIFISRGDYQKTVEQLRSDPHPVMKMIQVPEGTKRPDQGIKSQKFAGLCYQLLLRGYVGIGVREIENALKTMRDLEKLTPNAEDVLSIYVQLGRELEQEIERLKGRKQSQRLAEVRASFEKFLNELFNRKQDMAAGSLLWIAETYYGLGKGMSDDKAAAASQYEHAAETYQEIINNAERQGTKWLDPAHVAGVRLRLVNCRRHQQQFETAREIVAAVLQEKPNALDAQIEAAYVLQDWADSGQGDNGKRFLEAIKGTDIGPDQTPVWGWGRTALFLQRRIEVAAPDRSRKLYPKLYEVRYNSVWCRLRWGQAQIGTPNRTMAFRAAKQEILAFVAISDSIDEEWWKKFDMLYQNILRNLGGPVVKLQQPQEFKPVAMVDMDAATPTKKKKTAAVAPKTTLPPGGPGWLLGGLGFVLVLGVFGYTIYFLISQSARRRPVTVYAETAPILPPELRRPAARKNTVAGKTQAASRAAAKKPATPKSGPGQ